MRLAIFKIPLRTLHFAAFATIVGAVSPSIAASEKPHQSQQTQISAGLDMFEFRNWPGPSLPVWTYVPASVDPKTAPILFVMHGARRDPKRYRDQWTDKADKGSFIVIAPEFSRKDFRGSRNYNLGAMFDQESTDLRHEKSWSFSAIEPIFDEVVAQLNGKQTDYTIFGHSAGSQFVHRFLLMKPETRAKRYLAANAGWYTFVDLGVAYPFGLAGTPADEKALRQALAKDVIILLGDQDTDPDHSSLNRSEGAMLQGPHRFARGQSFYVAAQAIAEKNGWDFGWSLRVIPGVAHSNGGIAEGAYDLVE
ncbi:hypothetical protein [Erythrobacter crassostreae]|uniref:Alpha/beta hydrolase n=1 Tax=Erythrobacter crassostreae TaxID=2828328 RepID=A0A9X1F566_9SPHN|nr:hypothetical protein [Erythrobacter crassostrea]MBV7260294.1 hypothetical protein [Erythrobacter crassostrea]